MNNATPPERPSGFLRSLFLGELPEELWLPFPTRPPEETDATIQIVEAVADFARARIDARKIDEEGSIPPSVLAGMKELGLFGMIVPQEFGGSGLGSTTYGRVLEELAFHCASCATTVGAHQSIGLKALLLFGTPEQKLQFLPPLASGEQLAAFALTEPGAGSDAHSITTKATPIGDSWIISGEKVWITNGGIASFFTVFARTPDPADATKTKLTCFAVPRNAPGVSIGKEEKKMGLRGSSTTAVFFENVKIPDLYRIGPAGGGFKVAMEVLNNGRHGLAAGCLGLGRAALADALAHAKTRQQFGKPIIEFGLVEEMLANAKADLYIIECGCRFVAGRMDEGAADVSLESAACKVFATEALWRIVNDSLQIAGGAGFMREYAYERRLRDARVNLIFEGTNQILRLYLTLQGLRGPGDEWKRLGAALKHPILQFPELTRATSRRLRRSLPRKPPKNLSKWLRNEAAVVAECAQELSEAAGAALRKHQKNIVNAQLTLSRLADGATSLFLYSAVVAKLALAESGNEQIDEPTARLALRRLYRGFRGALDSIQPGDEKLLADVGEGLRQ